MGGEVGGRVPKKGRVHHFIITSILAVLTILMKRKAGSSTFTLSWLRLVFDVFVKIPHLGRAQTQPAAETRHTLITGSAAVRATTHTFDVIPHNVCI